MKQQCAALAEILALYFGLPVALALCEATRGQIYATMLVFAAGCFVWLLLQPDQTLRGLALGSGWSAAQKRAALVRFTLCLPLLVLATFAFIPERFLVFPAQRPAFWALVMVLYPLLSVTVQVLVFRVFFFARYEKLFGVRVLLALNALCFAFAHALYGNWIAPVFAGVGGLLFAYSYRQHRSLLWGVLEHGLYGDVAFTLGIGWFFFKHAG